jgi:transposase
MKTTARRNGLSLQEIMANETPGGRGLLAAEIAQKTGREHGPVDGHCEVCGQAAESFILQDWINWHCLACVKVVVQAQFAAMAA